jgi:hypothetical protein
LAAVAAALVTFSVTPARADQNWACSLALCLANPAGPLAVAQCVPHVKRAWRAWARRKSVPSCIKVDAKNVEQGELTDQEGRITMSVSDPMKNCPTEFRYYATRHKKEFCAFSGVTEQRINGQLWGRIWYGGPDGRPWVEQLVVDAKNPRPVDTLPTDWAPIKADIQAKADYAHSTYQVWQAAEKHARDTEVFAQTAWNEATDFNNWLQAYIAAIESNISGTRDGIDQARADLEAFYPELVAAEQAANAVGATWQDKMYYEMARQKAHGLQQTINDLQALHSYWVSQRAQVPFHEAKAFNLVTTAQNARAVAERARADADAAKVTADAAEEAAKPLPPPWAGDQD